MERGLGGAPLSPFAAATAVPPREYRSAPGAATGMALLPVLPLGAPIRWEHPWHAAVHPFCVHAAIGPEVARRLMPPPPALQHLPLQSALHALLCSSLLA